MSDAERKPYTIKEMLAMEKRGELDGLSSAEVEEFGRYKNFTAQVDAEVTALNAIDAVKNDYMKQLADLRTEVRERLNELEANAIMANYHDELRKIAEAFGTHEEGEGNEQGQG